MHRKAMHGLVGLAGESRPQHQGGRVMPNRLIREGLIESEAVLSLPVEGRWLFVTIMLSADDLGLFEATEFKLARRADIRREIAGKLLSMLQDADLIRLYEVDGKRFGFIPRFRQRVQIKRTRYPMPDQALMADDKDAVSKINELGSKTTVGQPLDSSCASATQPSEPEPEPEEEKYTVASPLVGRADAYRPPDCPFQDLLSAYHECCPSLPEVRVMTNMRMKHARARWVQVCSDEKWGAAEALDWFRSYFRMAERSQFLTGKAAGNKRAWRADFEWLMTAGNFAKVVEGRYHPEMA